MLIPQCVSNGNTMNNAGFRIRVDSRLRQDFIEACRAQDKPAAQVLRAFMREFVRDHMSARQEELFPNIQETTKRV